MFKRLKQRWKQESPKVFKRITNTCVGIGSAATTVLALSVVPGIQLPEQVFKISSYILLGATIIGLPSKLTIKPEENV